MFGLLLPFVTSERVVHPECSTLVAFGTRETPRLGQFNRMSSASPVARRTKDCYFDHNWSLGWTPLPCRWSRHLRMRTANTSCCWEVMKAAASVRLTLIRFVRAWSHGSNAEPPRSSAGMSPGRSVSAHRKTGRLAPGTPHGCPRGPVKTPANLNDREGRLSQIWFFSSLL